MREVDDAGKKQGGTKASHGEHLQSLSGTHPDGRRAGKGREEEKEDRQVYCRGFDPQYQGAKGRKERWNVMAVMRTGQFPKVVNSAKKKKKRKKRKPQQSSGGQ